MADRSRPVFQQRAYGGKKNPAPSVGSPQLGECRTDGGCLTAAETLAVPTQMFQGELDGTVLAASTEHFPAREAPEAVARALLVHLRR